MPNRLCSFAAVTFVLFALLRAAPAQQPALSIADSSLLEGDSGTNLLTFVVTLSAPSTNTVAVNYTTSNGTANNTDFVPRSGTLTFDPGVTNQVIEIGVKGDTLFETNETFSVILSSAVNATITRTTGVGTIINDDPSPVVSISDASLIEGTSSTNTLKLQVTLSAPTGLRILVAYSTSNGTARAGSDYLATNGVLSFSAGTLTLTQTVNVPIIGDFIFEPDEYFYVTLTSISNAVGGRVQAVGTIMNDDPQGPPPVNDDFEARVAIPSTTNTATVSNVSNADATKQSAEPDHAGSPGGRSVWWSWRAPVTGTATIDTFGSSFDTVLAIYQGNSLSNLSLIASNDNAAAGNLRSQCSFNVISNSDYAIAVDGVDAAGGPITLHLSTRAKEFIMSSDRRDDFTVIGAGFVYDLLETNNTLYFTGDLRGFGRPTASRRSTTLVDGIGQIDRRLPIINGDLYTVVPDDEGGWYIGGNFTNVGGLSINYLAHLLADLSVDITWNPDPDDYVEQAVLKDGLLYLEGGFTRIGGQNRNVLAALIATNGIATSWNPTVDDCCIYDLAAISNSVYIGGDFSSVAGQPRQGLAELDSTTGQVTSWNPGLSGVDFDPRIRLAVSDSYLYVAGGFSTLGGQSRHHLGAADRKTGLATPWNPAPDGLENWDLKIDCNTLYVGGEFSRIAGQPRSNLAAFDIATGALLDWKPNVTGVGGVFALAVSAETVYAGGAFSAVDGQPRRGLAAIDRKSGRATDWAPQPYNIRNGVLAAHSQQVWVFGDNLRDLWNVAAVDATTGELLPFDAHLGTTCATCQSHYLALAGDTLYLGGTFTNVGGQTRNGLAAVDATTGALRSWNPGLGPTGAFDVYAMTVVGDTLYVGGQFSIVGGQPRNNIAAISLSTGAITPWNPNADAWVGALAPLGSNIYVGGAFQNIGGAQTWGIAAISATNGLATPFRQHLDAPSYSGVVYSIVADSDPIYIGGDFQTARAGSSDIPRNNLAALSAATGTPTAWNPNANDHVHALARNRNLIVAAGWFTQIGSSQRNGLAEIDSTTGLATSWQPPYTDSPIIVRTQAYYAGSLVFPVEGSPRITTQPDDVLIPVNQTLTLQGQALGQDPLFYQWRRNGTNVIGATNAQLVIANAQGSDSGTYDLRVTNGLGLATSLEAIATVYQAPLITLQPSSQNASPGDTIILTAAASGSPTPRYQWRLNGANISGATGPTLTITNAQFTNGGSYSVAIANVGGGVISDVATLLVQGAPGGLTNNFADRMASMDSSGVLAGDNINASSEPDEPKHAAKPGGKSVWFSWIAPTNGIATFSTRGSSFDTLLGVYTGTALSNLVEVVSDEDRGGFFTSQAAFNAIGGTEYIVAIDGLAGASGNIVLSWNFDGSTVEFPRIISPPLSRTVAKGADTTFGVGVDTNSPSALRYQWFRGCDAIPGATNATLTIYGVRRADLGGYYVVVMNASTHVAQSDDAFLEIGPAAQTFTHDKFQDLLLTLGNGSALLQTMKNAQASSSGSFIGVSAGSVGSEFFNNNGSTAELGEPTICNIVGGASRWFGLYALANGTLMVDTVGSKIDTLLAAFKGPDLAHLTLLACDDNGAPDRIRSRIIYPTVSGTPYYILADGVNGAQGDVQLNWKFATVPVVASVPLRRQGTTVFLGASVTNSTDDTFFQWRRNGINILSGTNATFTLAGDQAGQVATYSLVVSNFAGIATNTIAAFVQLTPTLEVVNGQPQLRLRGTPSSSSFTIDASSDLVRWDSVYTNATTESQINYLEPISTSGGARFYRISP